MAIDLNITNALLPRDALGRTRAGRGRGGIKPSLIVLHIQEGYNDLSQFFRTVDADSTIWSKRDGQLVRMLYDTDAPWTNGDWTAPDTSNPVINALFALGAKGSNLYSLTIEHQGMPADGFTDAQLESSARMCAYWCVTWGIPADRQHIVGHYQVGPHKMCPGALFPWDKFVARVQELVAANNAAVVPAPAPSDVIVKNGHQLGHGMLTYWKQFDLPGVPHPLGLPISDEMDYTDEAGKRYTIQGFERAILGYDGTVADPRYRVQPLLIGYEWLKAHLPNLPQV